MFYSIYIKPFFDRLFGIVGLIVVSPVILLIFLILVFQNKGQAFFVQSRPGKGERVFKLLKFKTMTDATDTSGKPLPDRDRITKVGQMVRSLSIDELPQLWNVLKGDMSLVGPRPLLLRYLPLYNEQQKRRHDVKPGITGWAQVNGRNAISWKERLDYDVWYVDNMSLALDMKIIFMTIRKVLFRENIDASTSTTMKSFDQYIQEQKSK